MNKKVAFLCIGLITEPAQATLFSERAAKQFAEVWLHRSSPEEVVYESQEDFPIHLLLMGIAGIAITYVLFRKYDPCRPRVDPFGNDLPEKQQKVALPPLLPPLAVYNQVEPDSTSVSDDSQDEDEQLTAAGPVPPMPRTKKLVDAARQATLQRWAQEQAAAPTSVVLTPKTARRVQFTQDTADTSSRAQRRRSSKTPRTQALEAAASNALQIFEVRLYNLDGTPKKTK